MANNKKTKAQQNAKATKNITTSNDKTSILLANNDADDNYDSSQSVDFDEISAPIDSLDPKGEAFRRIASAEEIEEMSDDLLDDHVDLDSLSPEQRIKVEEELKKDLARTEDEIQTLRQVLNAKIKHSNDIKRKLGISVWKEFSEDITQGIKTIQETTASGMAMLSAPSYQKTTDAVKVASEKTTSMFGTFSGSLRNKLGEVKNSNAFKSFEERVGYAVTNVKTKIGSRSNSTNNFDEALRNSDNLYQPSASPAIHEEIPEK